MKAPNARAEAATTGLPKNQVHPSHIACSQVNRIPAEAIGASGEQTVWYETDGDRLAGRVVREKAPRQAGCTETHRNESEPV